MVPYLGVEEQHSTQWLTTVVQRGIDSLAPSRDFVRGQETGQKQHRHVNQ